MRAARREALLGLGLRDRRFGWPLEMVLRAADAGWRIEEIPVSYRRREGRSKVTGTVRGTAADDRRHDEGDAGGPDPMSAIEPIDPADVSLIVIAKAPLPGFAKTRLIPDLGEAGAARVAEAMPRRHALGRRRDPARRARILVLDGEPGDWLPRVEGREFEVIPQRDGGLGDRLAGAFEDSGAAPALLVGMDTPQITASLLEASIEALCADGVDAVLGPPPTAAGGRSACATATRRSSTACR